MKSLIRNKQQKKTKQLLQKKTNASRNRVHKKTNIFNRNKNIYYAQKGGSIETAKDYFIANYPKAIDAIRQSIYDDTTLKKFVIDNFKSIIDAKKQEIDELQRTHTTSMQKINSQITTSTAKSDIILQKQKQKNTNTKTFEDKKASIQSIIEQLKSSNVNTIYDDPKLLFEFIIKYLSPPNTTFENINIDLFVKFYLNGAMGNPNSIGNIGQLVDSITDFELLKTHCKLKKDITDFKGLTGDDINYLEHFINQQDYKDCLQEHKELKAAEAEAKQGADILINITNEFGSIVVYWLKTEAAAKFYGQRTKWCTAAEKHNNFNSYNQAGNIYMITVKKTGKNASRYQLQVEYDQFMDERNEPYDIQKFMELIEQIDSDKQISNWFVSTYNLYKLSKDETTLTLIYNISLNYMPYSLNKLKKLTSLILLAKFNQPLGDSLNGLTNLQSLTLGGNFDQPLGDSLNELTNLQSLTLGYSFNKPLGDSLNKLQNLQNLEFYGDYKQPFNIKQLSNLKELVINGTNIDIS